MRSLDVIPECSIDTTLTESITSDYESKYYYNHQKGCNTVCNEMKRRGNNFALGIMDDDKRKDLYLEEFDEIIHLPDNLPLKLLKHRTSPQYIILLQEDAESFILNAIDEINLSPGDFGLPTNKKQLKEEYTEFDFDRKHPAYNKFRYIFRQLKEQGSISLRILSLWISYLRDNKYNIDLEGLRQETLQIINPN